MMNTFLNQLENKSKEELINILNKPESYQDEALIAAQTILKDKYQFIYEPIFEIKKVFHFKLEENHTIPIRFLGCAGLIGVMGLIGFATFISWIIGVALCVSLIYIDYLLRRRSVTINLTENKIHKVDALKRDSASFTEIETLSINSVSMRQNYNSRGYATTIRFTLYKGYAMIDEVKILIAEQRVKSEIMKEMKPLAEALNLEITDNTQK